MNEEDRLQTLHALELLDTVPEEDYDELVELASEICSTPMSLVSLVDRERQWFKASKGISAKETHRKLSFCAHAIQQADLFVVEDTRKDRRFADNGLVTGELGVRFYAGVPLHAPNGHALGTLCVIDTIPRELTASQQKALHVLGRQVETLVALRAERKGLHEAVLANERLSVSLRKSNGLFRAFMDHGPFISYIKDEAGRFVFYNGQLARQFGITSEEWIGKTDAEFLQLEIAHTHRMHDLIVLEGGVPVEVAEVSPGPGDRVIHWNSYKFPFQQDNGDKMLAGISVDVTANREQKAALERSLQEKDELAHRLEASRLLFHEFADNSPNLAFLKDEDGRYVFYNRLFAEHFGIDQAAWLGKRDEDVLPNELAEQLHCKDSFVLKAGQKLKRLCRLPNLAGMVRVFRLVEFAYTDADGRKMLANVASDITNEIKRERELTEANRRLDQLATTDFLTGIANRRAFEAAMEVAFTSSIRTGRPISVLAIDIDHFKLRNDTLGHAAGDAALAVIGRVLHDCGRAGDLPARIGGEEFVFLLPDSDEAGANAIADRIQRQLKKEQFGPLPLTVSIGVAMKKPATRAWQDLVATADSALYRAKMRGRNCVVSSEELVAI